MTRRTRKMSLSEARTRREHAHAFLHAAELVREFGGDASIEHLGNTVGSLAVLAGIAASDAICGITVGEYAAGEAHVEAVRLLEQSKPGRPLAASLKRLIDAKTEAAYSPRTAAPVAASDRSARSGVPPSCCCSRRSPSSCRYTSRS